MTEAWYPQATGWVKPYGTWVTTDDDLNADTAALMRQLHEVMAQREVTPLHEPTFMVADSRCGDWFGRGVVLFCEALGITLTQPNPFPRLRLFRWLPC